MKKLARLDLLPLMVVLAIITTLSGAATAVGRWALDTFDVTSTSEAMTWGLGIGLATLWVADGLVRDVMARLDSRKSEPANDTDKADA